MFGAFVVAGLMSFPIVLWVWLKVGPMAGIVATVLFVLWLYVLSQPGGQWFGNFQGSWRTRQRSSRKGREGPPTTPHE